MFGLFRPAVFVDPALGEFKRSGGRWRGTIELAGRVVPLAVSGPSGRPDAEAMAAASALPAVWAQNSGSVARALLEHLAPYREAVEAGEADAPSEPFPAVGQPADVWASVQLQSASVTRLGGKLTSEVALAATWDEEHTLGARFHGAAFVELNGSILPE